MRYVCSVAVLVFCLSPTFADTTIVLDDFEGTVGPWPGMTLVSEPVRGGDRALRWEVASRVGPNSPRFLADWTKFDELRFWAYLPAPVDFHIPLVFPTEGGYYITDWKLDWEGWKEHRFKLADCRPVHAPVGWHEIHSIGFRAQGYGQGPVPEGLVIVFDDFTLHSPEDMPETSLADWMARERRERLMKLRATGNPYYQSVYDSLKNVKAEPEPPADIPSSWTYAGLTGQALSAAWAASFDESPRKGDATLIARAVALINFCLQEQKDGSWFYSRKWTATADPNSDRFALGPLMDAVYWLRRLPDMEDNWRRWEAPLRELVEFQYKHWGHYADHGFTDNIAWGSSAFTYPNQDVFYLHVMALAHEFWGEERYRSQVVATLDGLEAHLLPNGGLNYIGPETEIPNYHDLNIVWIARYYDLTGDERARELLAATAPYYPGVSSNEGRPENYTDCWWKHHWGDGQAAGPEIVAGITGDPHNKWLANRLLERRGTGSGYFAIYAGMFYREGVPEEPLPDNWLIRDGNIGGPRGRFGSWYFAGVPGGGARDTFVGAMVCDDGGGEPLKGALLAAVLEVGQPGGPRNDLYVSGHDDITHSAIMGDMAVLGARYTVRRPYINSVRGREIPPTPWQGTQVWLLTRHGLVGLMEVEAAEELTVPYLGAELRLGPRLALRATEDGAYCAGRLCARVLETSLPSVTSGNARPPYAQTESRHEAVILRTSGEEWIARPGEPQFCAVLITPEGADAIGDFTRLDADGLWAFQVSIEGRPVVAAFNPGQEAVTLRLAWQAASCTEPGEIGAVPDGVGVTLAPRTAVIVTAPPGPKS